VFVFSFSTDFFSVMIHLLAYRLVVFGVWVGKRTAFLGRNGCVYSSFRRGKCRDGGLVAGVCSRGTRS
jgi:hypothetical protein